MQHRASQVGQSTVVGLHTTQRRRVTSSVSARRPGPPGSGNIAQRLWKGIKDASRGWSVVRLHAQPAFALAFIGWAGGRGICPPNLQFTPGSRIAGESQAAAGSPLGQPGRAPLGLRPRCVRCAMRGAGPQRSADVPHGVAPGLRREGTAAQSRTPSQAAPWPASPSPAPPACLWL